MLIFCLSEFKNLIQPSFVIFRCVFFCDICVVFLLHLHVHVHPQSFKVQCRLRRDRGSRQTGVNILPKYLVRIWINFRRCERSMITRFLSVCRPIILEANFYISGCVRVWSACGLQQTTTVSTCSMEGSAQIQTFPSHTDKISFHWHHKRFSLGFLHFSTNIAGFLEVSQQRAVEK